jgi:hypothetical protein
MSAIYYCDVCRKRVSRKDMEHGIGYNSKFQHLCQDCVATVEIFLTAKANLRVRSKAKKKL